MPHCILFCRGGHGHSGSWECRIGGRWGVSGGGWPLNSKVFQYGPTFIIKTIYFLNRPPPPSFHLDLPLGLSHELVADCSPLQR